MPTVAFILAVLQLSFFSLAWIFRVCARRLFLGMAVGGNQTYAAVTPTISAISSNEITVAWAAPVDTGKSPVTGYQLYMFDGVGLNSQADPEPVKHEIQVNRRKTNDMIA